METYSTQAEIVAAAMTGPQRPDFKADPPANLWTLWYATRRGTEKLTNLDVTADLSQLAIRYLLDVATRWDDIDKHPGDFIVAMIDTVHREYRLYDGQARGVLNYMRAAMQGQRRRWGTELAERADDATEHGSCAICGKMLDTDEARTLGVGKVCWERLLGVWGRKR